MTNEKRPPTISTKLPPDRRNEWQIGAVQEIRAHLLPQPQSTSTPQIFFFSFFFHHIVEEIKYALMANI